ncbi:ABC transporter permease, partial [Streptomyces sp. NPDC052196]
MSSQTMAGAAGRISPGRGVRPLVRHSLALTRRNLRKAMASPGQIIDATLMPVTLSLVFIYTFGGAVSGD